MWYRVRIALALVLCARVAAADDVITTRDGERIEGLVVEADPETVTVRWGAGRAVITRRVPRAQIASIRFGEPDVDGLRSLARRSETQGELADAAIVWRIVCGLKPEAADDHLQCARAMRLSGQLDAAAAAIECATRIEPGTPKLLMEHGEIALARGECGRAAELASDALKAGPSIAAQWLLARALEGARLTDEAIAAYRRLLELEPTHLAGLERVVGLLLQKSAAIEAEKLARSFIHFAPDVRAGRVALGSALFKQTRWGEAVDAFRAATALGGPGYDRARVYLHVARARAGAIDPSTGLSEGDLSMARELDPELVRSKP
jgi:tetratricopeptide (TPR) repeat protein